MKKKKKKKNDVTTSLPGTSSRNSPQLTFDSTGKSTKKKPSNKQIFQNLEETNTNQQKLREREMARNEIQDGD